MDLFTKLANQWTGLGETGLAQVEELTVPTRQNARQSFEAVLDDASDDSPEVAIPKLQSLLIDATPEEAEEIQYMLRIMGHGKKIAATDEDNYMYERILNYQDPEDVPYPSNISPTPDINWDEKFVVDLSTGKGYFWSGVYEHSEVLNAIGVGDYASIGSNPRSGEDAIAGYIEEDPEYGEKFVEAFGEEKAATKAIPMLEGYFPSIKIVWNDEEVISKTADANFQINDKVTFNARPDDEWFVQDLDGSVGYVLGLENKNGDPRIVVQFDNVEGVRNIPYDMVDRLSKDAGARPFIFVVAPDGNTVREYGIGPGQNQHAELAQRLGAQVYENALGLEVVNEHGFVRGVWDGETFFAVPEWVQADPPLFTFEQTQTIAQYIQEVGTEAITTVLIEDGDGEYELDSFVKSAAVKVADDLISNQGPITDPCKFLSVYGQDHFWVTEDHEEYGGDVSELDVETTAHIDFLLNIMRERGLNFEERNQELVVLEEDPSVLMGWMKDGTIYVSSDFQYDEECAQYLKSFIERNWDTSVAYRIPSAYWGDDYVYNRDLFPEKLGAVITDEGIVGFEGDEMGNNHKFILTPNGEFYAWGKKDYDYGKGMLAIEHQGTAWDELDDFTRYEWERDSSDTYDFYRNQGYATGTTSSGGFFMLNAPSGLNEAQIEAVEGHFRDAGYKSIVIHESGTRNFFNRAKDALDWLSPRRNPVSEDEDYSGFFENSPEEALLPKNAVLVPNENGTVLFENDDWNGLTDSAWIDPEGNVYHWDSASNTTHGGVFHYLTSEDRDVSSYWDETGDWITDNHGGFQYALDKGWVSVVFDEDSVFIVGKQSNDLQSKAIESVVGVANQFGIEDVTIEIENNPEKDLWKDASLRFQVGDRVVDKYQGHGEIVETEEDGSYKIYRVQYDNETGYDPRWNKESDLTLEEYYSESASNSSSGDGEDPVEDYYVNIPYRDEGCIVKWMYREEDGEFLAWSLSSCHDIWDEEGYPHHADVAIHEDFEFDAAGYFNGQYSTETPYVPGLVSCNRSGSTDPKELAFLLAQMFPDANRFIIDDEDYTTSARSGSEASEIDPNAPYTPEMTRRNARGEEKLVPEFVVSMRRMAMLESIDTEIRNG